MSKPSRITRFLKSPIFEDEEKTRIADLINGMLLMIAAGAVLFLIFSRSAGIATRLAVSLPLIMLMITSILKLLLHRGYVQLSGTLLSLSVWMLFTVPMFTFDGIRDVTITGCYAAIVITSLILSQSTLILFTLLASLTFAAAYWAEINGLLITTINSSPSPIDLAVVLITLNITALLAGLTVRQIRQSEKATLAEKDKIQQYLDIARAIILTLDLNQNVTLINKRGCETLGCDKDKIIGKNWFDNFLPERIREDVQTYFYRLIAGEATDMEYAAGLVLTRNGEEKLISWHNTLLHDNDGNVIGTLSSGEDITERERSKREIEKRRQYLEGVLGAAPDAIITMNEKHHIVEWNLGAERLFGYTRAEVIGLDIDHLISNPECIVESLDLTQRVMLGEEIRPIETVRYHKDGSAINVILAGAPIILDDEFVGGVAIYTDISERKRMEEQLAHLATHDPLTNLPNRTLLRDRLEHALNRSARHKDDDAIQWEIGVLMIDLDNFKSVNDTLGHAIGDLLLQSIAQRLQKRIRRSDTVARLGGDEFVLIFENVNGYRDSTLLAKKILNVFSNPFDLGKHRVSVKASIGISLYPQDGNNAETLFKQADKAMYAAKISGNTYRSYSEIEEDTIHPKN
ncbi:MAG: diguanylate cyclase [Anaerolineales bacterium]|nr:diguanylate cyclase [Anaerolineales bacterium]